MRFGRRKAVQNDSPLAAEVRAAMEDARAYAKGHGGDIELVDVSDDGTVRIRFKGTCSFCPLSTVTMKLVVEARLKELVPAVRRVVSA